MKHVLWAFWSVVIFSSIVGCGNTNSPSPSEKLSWVLEDSVILRSTATDTIFYGWPYKIGERFYVMDLYANKVFQYDMSGKMTAVLGKGPGEGPGEFWALDAVFQYDSLIGIYDNNFQGFHLFDTRGTFHHRVHLRSDLDGTNSYYVNAFGRNITYFDSHFYNFAYIGVINIDQPEWYHLPYIAIHDKKGELLKVVGEHAPIYREKLLTHLNESEVYQDGFAHSLWVTQKATQDIVVMNVEGVSTGKIGKPGTFIEDQTWEPYAFENQHNTKEGHQEYLRLYFQSPEYRYAHGLKDYILRSYRRGVEEYATLTNFLDKPHYLQVYDREGSLLNDQPAPDMSFIPIGRSEDNSLWVTLTRSYDAEAFTFTVYQYRLTAQQ